jgi:hypothetical protein
MATDSTAAGYLSPSSLPAEDDTLDDVVHDAIVGITGITGDLVRPRWQPEPPTQPDFSVDWIAFGLTRSEEDVFTYDSTDGTTYTVQRDEMLYFLVSAYGPNAGRTRKVLSDGLAVNQNRDALYSNGLALVEVQEMTKVPALFKEKWVYRVDSVVVFRRRTRTVYPVVTITSGQMGLNNELYVTPINVTHP